MTKGKALRPSPGEQGGGPTRGGRLSRTSRQRDAPGSRVAGFLWDKGRGTRVVLIFRSRIDRSRAPANPSMRPRGRTRFLTWCGTGSTKTTKAYYARIPADNAFAEIERTLARPALRVEAK